MDLRSQFADLVLLRTRSGTGVPVYQHRDGSWGFLARPDDLAVTRTVPHRVSYGLRCRTCGTRRAFCTTLDGVRVATPCACESGRKSDVREIDGMLEWPEIDLDFFAASVRDEVVRLGGFALVSMVRGFLVDYWPAAGRRPDAALWARFYVESGRVGPRRRRSWRQE